MASTNEIVSVSIVIRDASASASNFGTLCIVAPAPHTPGTIATYTLDSEGLASMVDDGFPESGSAYRMATIAASQESKTDSVVIFSRANKETKSYTFTPINVEENAEYSLSVRGTDNIVVDLEYTAVSGDTATSVVAGLIASGTPVGVTMTSGSTLVLTVTDSDNEFQIETFDGENLEFLDTSSGGNIATDLTNAKKKSDFYGVLTDTTESSQIQAAAAWAESNGVIYLAVTSDTGVCDSSSDSDVLYSLKASGYYYTGVGFTRNPSDCFVAGLIARQFSQDPGTSTWSLKTLSGVTVDTLTTTEHNAIISKNGMTFESYSDISLARDGNSVQGRFFDLTRGKDWLAATMQANILTHLANRERVNIKDKGIGEIEGVMQSTLSLAKTRDFISTFTTDVPTAADIPASERASGKITGFKFSGECSGAFHGVTIVGSLTL